MIPSTLATFFRTDRGRVAHRIDATLTGKQPIQALKGLEFPSRFQDPAGRSQQEDPTSTISARSNDKGNSTDIPMLKEDLQATKEIWIFAVPTSGLQPLALDQESSHFIPGLGILNWKLLSSSCTVAGVVLLSLKISDPEPLATLWMVKLSVTQQITMTSPQDASRSHAWPPTECLIWARGRLPETQQEYIFSSAEKDIPIWQGDLSPGPTRKKGLNLVDMRQAVRLPDSLRLRPTTLDG